MKRRAVFLIILALALTSTAQITNPEAEAILITKMADEYLKTSEYEMAIYYYQKSLSIYPGYVKTQFQLAQSFRLSLQLDSARFHYQKIISNNQDLRYPMSRYHLAMMQLDQQKYSEARENLIVFRKLLLDNNMHVLKKYQDFYAQTASELDKLK